MLHYLVLIHVFGVRKIPLHIIYDSMQGRDVNNLKY